MKRQFSADKKLRVVAQNVNTEYNEVEYIVEVEDKGYTRLFRMYFDLEDVIYNGVELQVSK